MSAYDLKGKVAIVTGAGSGINHALSEMLLEAGCSVVMADVRLRPAAQQTVDEHPLAQEPSAVFKSTDMSNWAQIRALWDFALQTYGRVHIVVNGAGVYEPPSSAFWNPPGHGAPLSPGVAAPEDDADAALGQYKTFAINTTGPIRLAQIAVQYWLEHREVGGNLLWFASVAGYLHGIVTPLYYSSKAAIVSMCKSLGALRENTGIRNSSICPGTVHSPMIDVDQKHINIRPDDIGMTPKECAEIAMRILQEPQYGDGNIGGQSIRTRDVPMEMLYPVLDGSNISSFIAESETNFRRKLQQTGMRDLLG
ncbi:15-hydroxyprostaglandin dehydrogenase [Apiospora marii]|uniref:15-hydroxyprostaglandin dehydrogenase n=1 Tax=Apiospora marii TaxID=335849 RepID=UPI00313284DF